MSDRSAYLAEYRSRPENKEKQREHQKNWRQANPKRYKDIKKKYRVDNDGLAIERPYARAKRKRERAELSDVYLRYMLKKHMEGVVKNIPPELIEIYRKLLLTKRLLKIKKHGSNNKCELLTRHEKSTKRKPCRIANGKKKAVNRKRSK
mgnify:CR=1 FL=1